MKVRGSHSLDNDLTNNSKWLGNVHVNYAGSGLLPENKCQHMITLSLIFLHWIINEMFPLLNIGAVVNGYSKIF